MNTHFITLVQRQRDLQSRNCFLFQDIQFAFDAGYPKKFFKKLINRKCNAEKAKDNQACLLFHQPLPSLSFPAHKYIEAAADCLEIKENTQFGRHLVASRDIPVGSVIAIEKAFVSVLSPKNFLNHCAHCLHVSYNLVRKLYLLCILENIFSYCLDSL